MLQIIGYFLCIYLCFKGAEIWMIGKTSPKELGNGPRIIGALMFIASLVIALLFFLIFSAQSSSFPIGRY